MTFRISIFIAAILLSTNIGQSQGQAPQQQIIVQRATIPNFVADPMVAGNAKKSDYVSANLPSTFILTSPVTGQSIIWSPALCRLIALKKGKNTTFLEMEAEGPHPFAFSLGAMGKPKFFGFRMVKGNPEFLYTYGQLAVEEKFKFTDDGTKILQTFNVQSNAIDGSYSVTEKIRSMVTGDNGRWNGNVLTLRRDELKTGFTITYHLDPNKLR